MNIKGIQTIQDLWLLVCVTNNTTFRISSLVYRLYVCFSVTWVVWWLTNTCHFSLSLLHFCLLFGFLFTRIRMRSWESWNFRILYQKLDNKIKRHFLVLQIDVHLCLISQRRSFWFKPNCTVVCKHKLFDNFFKKMLNKLKKHLPNISTSEQMCFQFILTEDLKPLICI